MTSRRFFATVAGIVSVVVLCWMLGAPAGSGPDEPSHLVRAAALARGNTDGVITGTMSVGPELPAWIGSPDPSCYALKPYVPASCAGAPEPIAGTTAFVTTATAYPVWGHLTYAPGTYAPAEVGWWASRLSGAVLPVVLVAGAMLVASNRSRLQAVSVLLAVTPMAWFSFGVVNPSALVIAGGIAFGMALLAAPGGGGIGWLMACGWAAMVLPRRDGLVWACLVLLVVVIAAGRPLASLVSQLDWRQRGVMIGTAAIAIVSGIASRAESSTLVIVAPLATAAALFAWSRRRHVSKRPAAIWVGVALVVGMLAAGLWLLADQRPGGFNATAYGRMIVATGENLVEAIGLLGWLDTPVPTTMVLLWTVALGTLVGASLVSGSWTPLITASTTIGVAIFASWGIESMQLAENNWQGRYYLPLLVLVPIALGAVDLDEPIAGRFARVVGGISLVVSNVAFVAALRRWGVGLDGSMLPTKWDTYGAPLHPLLLIVLHLAATTALVVVVLRSTLSVGRVDQAADEFAETVVEGRPIERHPIE